MTKTLLDGVNEVLKRVGILESGNLLSTLTDSGKQVYIDLAVQIWNEGIDRLYDMNGEPRPKETREKTITLVADQREYKLASDLVELEYPLVNESEGYRICEYQGGYLKMRSDQLVPDDYTGLPHSAIINPSTNMLRMDYIPTSNEAGLQFKYLYHKDDAITDADEFFPFGDAVFRAMVTAVSQEWTRRKNRDFDQRLFFEGVARASSFLQKRPRRTHW